MITRYTEVTDSLEKQFISLCCQEETELNIVPCLNRVYSIKINKPSDFLIYTHLMEKIILSCATLYKLREIKSKLRSHHEKSPELIKEIVFIKENMHAKDRYRRLFDMYFQGQHKINTALTTSINLFNFRSKLIDLEELLLAASNGMSHVKKIFALELPLTTSCYIKAFNEKLNHFLHRLESDAYITDLYMRYNDKQMNEADFKQASRLLAERLTLSTGFIDRYLSEEMFSKEDLFFKNKIADNHSEMFLELMRNVSSLPFAVIPARA